MTTQNPTPFPISGVRVLSPREQFDAACARSRVASVTECESQIYVGIFFDGTGNNMKLDYEDPPPERRKHTNVVKLFQAFPSLPQQGKFRVYLPGVGTPFPEVGDSNHPDQRLPNLGSIGAEMGEHRILWALLQLINVPSRFHRGMSFPLIPNKQARMHCGDLASSFSSAGDRRRQLLDLQNLAVEAMRGYKPRITQIRLSVFGFSRGAAEARVFVNWLMELCEPHGASWRFAGIPLDINFLGLFDTVASVGAANLFDGGTLAGHQGWADNTLQIHPAVRQCVHYVAAHELRACFPLDSVRVKDQYPVNAVEIMYPGAHSDVGGGYAPGALGVGRSPDANLSILPGRDMYHAAFKAGVPLPAFNSLKASNPDLAMSLMPSDELLRIYNAYLKDAAVTSGPVEAVHQKHMALYHTFRFKYRNEFERLPFVEQAPPMDKGWLRRTQAAFIERLNLLTGFDRRVDPRTLLPLPTMGSTSAMSPTFDPATKAVEFQKKMVARSDDELSKLFDVALHIKPGALTTDIERMFSYFVHDSLAGFMGLGMDEYRHNRLGLAKYRTVFKGDD